MTSREGRRGRRSWLRLGTREVIINIHAITNPDILQTYLCGMADLIAGADHLVLENEALALQDIAHNRVTGKVRAEVRVVEAVRGWMRDG
jgi:hypothetical protein